MKRTPIRKTQKKNNRIFRVFEIVSSIMVWILLSWVVLIIWRGYVNQIEESQRNEVILTGQFISQQFAQLVKQDIEALENLKERIEISNGDFFQFWAYDARRILEQNPSFLLVEWIDSNKIIQRIEPLRGNESALFLDLNSVPYRTQGWIKTKTDSATNITEWAQLTQLGNAFLVDVPVFYGAKFRGTITGAFNFSWFLDAMMQRYPMYNAVAVDNLGQQFYEANSQPLSEHSEGMTYTTYIVPSVTSSQNWGFTLKPNLSFFEQNRLLEKRLSLMLGLVLAALLSLALFLLLKSRRESARVKMVNMALNKSNRNLAIQMKKAEDASNIKSEFLSNMSHEIRTPLNAVLGLIGIMQRSEHSMEQSKYLAMMEFSSKNLLWLVNDILEIDKIESGKVELKKLPFSPLSELQSILDLYQPSFDEKQLKLQLDINGSTDVEVIGDSVKYNQILTNLVRNAFKFTEKGFVKVSYHQQHLGERLRLEIEIKDSGIGIPPEKLSSIFDRFTQVEGSYNRKYEGSGLGLAITKKLVDAFEGDIQVSSEFNEGAKFVVRFSFPVNIETEIHETGQVEEKPSYPEAKILVVEDNALNILVITKFLEQFDIKAAVAKNGKLALDEVQNETFDLIFMDMHMPEMDGVEATQKMREQGLEMPIIGLSANVTHEAKTQGMEAGMQDYLTKPFTRDMILRCLKKYID